MVFLFVFQKQVDSDTIQCVVSPYFPTAVQAPPPKTGICCCGWRTPTELWVRRFRGILAQASCRTGVLDFRAKRINQARRGPDHPDLPSAEPCAGASATGAGRDLRRGGDLAGGFGSFSLGARSPLVWARGHTSIGQLVSSRWPWALGQDQKTRSVHLEG